MLKRAIVPALLITLLLTACGGGGAALEEKLEARRDEYSVSPELAFTMAVTADMGEEIFACTLRCVSTPEETETEVIAPDMVAGIRAAVRDGETALRYEGVELSFATETGGPLSAAPLLSAALRGGHIVRAWPERDGDTRFIAAEIYVDDTRTWTVWFEADTLVPVHAALSAAGAEILRCQITEFQYIPIT